MLMPTNNNLKAQLVLINQHLAKQQLIKRIALANLHLNDEELCIYESGTQYCVIGLMNKKSREVNFTFGLDLNSIRDFGLGRALISFIESTRADNALPVAV
jgi:hypothetical protein